MNFFHTPSKFFIENFDRIQILLLPENIFFIRESVGMNQWTLVRSWNTMTVVSALHGDSSSVSESLPVDSYKLWKFSQSGLNILGEWQRWRARGSVEHSWHGCPLYKRRPTVRPPTGQALRRTVRPEHNALNEPSRFILRVSMRKDGGSPWETSYEEIENWTYPM